MIGQPHVLSVTDVQRGLQALSAKLLHDYSQWTTIVDVNQLQPPYITLDPSEVYGPVLSELTLSSSLSAGSTNFVAPNQPQNVTMLYFSGFENGVAIAESATVTSYDNVTFSLRSPLKNTYPAGSRVQLFSRYETGNTNVLLPGDILVIPIQDSSLTFIGTTLTDTFGTDFAFPMHFSQGDFAVASGVAVLNQRMVAAVETEIQSLPLHPTFGSRLTQKVGNNASTAKWASLVREALLKLPEVANVTDVVVTIKGNQVAISASVVTQGSNTSVLMFNHTFTLPS